MSLDHDARRKTLGASEIAAACGLNPWVSRRQLWELKTGRAQPFKGNASTEIGNWLEGPVCEWYASQHPEIIRIEKPETRYAKHRPWSSNPDFLIFADTRPPNWLLEVKTGTEDEGWGKSGSKEIPDYYYVQGQWQLYLEHLEGREIDRVDFALFLKGDVPDYERRREYSFPKDRERLDKLIQGAEDFWGYVERDEPPPEEVKDDKPVVEATPEIEGAILAKTHQAKVRADAEQAEKAARAKLIKLIPQGAKCSTAFGSASWSERKGKPVTDWEAAFWDAAERIKDEGMNWNPQIIVDSRTNTTEPVWVLTVKGKK